ncbi:MAG: Gfo/Idh/MocA family oxidoreductase [Angelakisella sp.]
MKTVHIGIIGCGYLGNYHLQNLLGMEGVSITALVSTNEERLQQTAQKVPGAQLFHNYQELFASSVPLDAVIVSIPPATHGEIEQLAAQKGIHLYVEKPLDVSLERARKNAAFIAQSGIICSVGYQGRYSPIVQELREKLRGEQTGLVCAKWIGDMPSVHWWRDKSLSGGQLVEQATHLVDVLRYLFGEVDTVYSRALSNLNNGVEGKTVEDCSSTILTFCSGVIATVMTGCYCSAEVPEDISIQIYTKKELIDLAWANAISYRTQRETVSKNHLPTNHRLAMQQFVTAVQTGDRSLIQSDYADALKTFEVTLAANRSMQEGQQIQL